LHAFIVDLKNRPGELAKVTEAIAKKSVNLTGFTGAQCGDGATLVLTATDEPGIRGALRDGAYSFREVELVTAALPDEPGALAKVARRLADAGVNIDAAMPTGMSGGSVHVAFATNDPTKTKEAIKEWLAMPVVAR
jgi:hypothetical protein